MNRLVFVAGAILLTGCATNLNVEVSILERKIVDDLVLDDRLHAALPIIQAETQPDIAIQVESLREAHYAVYAESALAIAEEIKAMCQVPRCDATLAGKVQSVDAFEVPFEVLEYCDSRTCDADVQDLASIANDLAGHFDGAWGAKYGQFARDWHAVNGSIRAFHAESMAQDLESVEYLRTRREINMALDQRDAIISNFFERVRADVGEGLGSGISEQINDAQKSLNNRSLLARVFRQTVGELNQRQKMVAIMDSGGLEHSKYASVLAGAHEDFWKKRFDFAKGNAYFGNADVAIKALGPTNFTIKGLSFNPADVAIAASKVTTQAVLLAAQISGVPVNISGTPPTGTGAELAKASAGLSTVQGNAAQSLANMHAFNLALDVIAMTILNESDSIQSGNNARIVESLDVIKTVYTSQNTRLDAVATSNGD